MDEIGQRLRECADNCVAAYETWADARKDADIRERLQEAVHELRKVSARLEIEMAVSEREEAQKPLPIPPHRSARRREQPRDADVAANESGLPGFITEGAQIEEGSHRPQQRTQRTVGNRRPGRRPQSPQEGPQDNAE